MCKIEKTSFFSKIDRFFASTDAEALTIFKNIVEKFVTIIIILKELIILFRRQKYNFIKENY